MKLAVNRKESIGAKADRAAAVCSSESKPLPYWLTVEGIAEWHRTPRKMICAREGGE